MLLQNCNLCCAIALLRSTEDIWTDKSRSHSSGYPWLIKAFDANVDTESVKINAGLVMVAGYTLLQC